MTLFTEHLPYNNLETEQEEGRSTLFLHEKLLIARVIGNPCDDIWKVYLVLFVHHQNPE